MRVWKNLLEAAGYHVQLEQEVLLHDHGTRRADLVARNDLGEHLALDVPVTGRHDMSQPVETHLHRQASQEASRYEQNLGELLLGVRHEKGTQTQTFESGYFPFG